MYMEIKRRMPIGVELVKRGIVTENDIEKALEYQREHPNVKLGDILHILNVCDDEILIKNISEITGEKGILLTSETMKVKPTDYLSFDMCKNNRCLPFEVTNGKIKVAFSDKTVNGKTDPVRMILLNKGLVMEKYLTFENDIDKILFSMEEENAGNDITKVTSSSGTTMIELIDNIIRTGMEKRASDIHIEPLVNEIRVRYRIDGELFTAAKIPKEIPMTDVEFCVVFGNIMDNAIEACEKLASKENKFIRVYIGVFKKQFYMFVSNSTDQKKRTKKYLSMKGEGHGFGLQRIDKIIHDKNGYLNRQNEPGVFATEIMLPYI